MIKDIILLLILAFVMLGCATFLTGIFLRVPFVPSNRKALRLLSEAKIPKNAKVCDLGSGNGKVLFYLRKLYPDIDLSGYELAVLPYFFSRIKNTIGKKHVHFYCKNFLKEDLSHYDVFFCYLMPEVMKKVVKKLEGYDKRFLLITNTFEVKGIAVKQKILPEKGRGKVLVYEINS